MKKQLQKLLLATLVGSVVSCNNNSSDGSITNKSTTASVKALPNATQAKLGYAYNSHGLLASVTNPLGGVTSYSYDENDNLTQITDALGHVIKLENYNELCNPQTIIDENGVATNLVYNDDVVWYL